MKATEKKPFSSPSALARRWRVSPTIIHRMVRNKRIRSVQLHKRVVIPESEIQRFERGETA
jgi:hypothetical protein